MRLDRKRCIKYRRILMWVILVLSACLLFDIAYYEPQHPVLNVYSVELPGLPKEMDGFKIVQLSDIHRRPAMPDSVIERAVEMANSTRPDVVVITGDLVGRNASRDKGAEARHAEPCVRILSKLKARYGLYAVPGNHDYLSGGDATKAALKRHNIPLLINRSIQIRKGLYLIGIDDLWEGKPDPTGAFQGVDESKACVILYHNLTTTNQLTGHRGLALTGHTHGGQFRLPFVHEVSAGSIGTWRDISGWYASGKLLIYVNRGIGMVNPALRYRCRPEVALFVLHPADKNDSLHRPHW